MLLKVNCDAWTHGPRPGYGRCRKGHHRGEPAVVWCSNECPPGQRTPADPTDIRAVIVVEPTGGAGNGWEQNGPLLWAELHRWGLSGDLAAATDWLDAFARRVACGECRKHWRNWVGEHPPALTDHPALFAWTVEAHNAVNRRLSRPELSLEAAMKHWDSGANPPATPEPPALPAASNVRPPPPTDPVAPPIAQTGAVDCEHAAPTPRATHVTCALGLLGGTPHVAMCRNCAKRRPGNVVGLLRLDTRPPAAQPGTSQELNAAARAPAPVPPAPNTAERLLLRSHLSPGDILMLTAAVRDLHRAYPGRFATAVSTSVPELWEHNPHVSDHDPAQGAWRLIDLHYPLVNHSNQRPVHFIHGYADNLGTQLGVSIPITDFRGDVYVTDDEKGWMNQVRERFGYAGRYWIMMAGGKYDYTAKWWPPAFYQQVVDHFLGRVQFVQCGQGDHWHPPLRGVFNLVGQTSVRQFVRLMYHADGVVCPVTFAMHLAAAVPTRTGRLRPCVVIAGGREPPHWEAYPGHQFLHTVGALPCCATGGCWKSRCQQVGDGDHKDHTNLCERPVPVEATLRVPQCMTMVTPQDVARAVERSLNYAE